MKFHSHTGYAHDSVVSIASWVTSAGRMLLLRAMREAGRDNVLYVDTDALIVNEAGYEALRSAGRIAGRAFGMLEIKSGPNVVNVRGIKHYVDGDRTICAGLPRGSCADTGDGETYWYTRRATDSVRHGMMPTAERELKRYSRSDEYRLGNVDELGRVTPFELDEWVTPNTPQ